MAAVKLLIAFVFLLLAGCTHGGEQHGPLYLTAIDALGELPTVEVLALGYEREKFGPAWKDVDRNGCDNRSDTMRRDMNISMTKEGTRGCIIQTGALFNLYTGEHLTYARGSTGLIEIDHIVSLADGWRTGMNDQDDRREAFANDPLNLLTTDRTSNRDKSDKTAEEWMVPDNPAYRCSFAARQVSVKRKYDLGVTDEERTVLHKVLSQCQGQELVPDDEVEFPRPFPIGEPRRLTPAPTTR